jgi:8-oxo-dGTP pyrophosphatase MutT (NUDIX family)
VSEPSLIEIDRDHDLDPMAPVVRRVAVRAVAIDGDRLLLLRSRHGDYKFPGGGVDSGEDLEAALRRELREECGVTESDVGAHLLTVVERAHAREPGAVFAMTSHYLACQVSGPVVAQDLDGYEAELRLEPVWVRPDEALSTNEEILARSGPLVPTMSSPLTGPSRRVLPWLDRETRVLRSLTDSGVLRG